MACMWMISTSVSRGARSTSAASRMWGVAAAPCMNTRFPEVMWRMASDAETKDGRLAATRCKDARGEENAGETGIVNADEEGKTDDGWVCVEYDHLRGDCPGTECP